MTLRRCEMTSRINNDQGSEGKGQDDSSVQQGNLRILPVERTIKPRNTPWPINGRSL